MQLYLGVTPTTDGRWSFTCGCGFHVAWYSLRFVTALARVHVQACTTPAAAA
jgi:hypothetical protein